MTTVVAVVSDRHANSTVPVCPPRITINYKDISGRVMRVPAYKLVNRSDEQTD